jgi:hypothetical protein
MISIRVQMPGTTVVQRLNQGLSRRLRVLPACRWAGAAGALFGYLFGQAKRYKRKQGVKVIVKTKI